MKIIGFEFEGSNQFLRSFHICNRVSKETRNSFFTQFLKQPTIFKYGAIYISVIYRFKNKNFNVIFAPLGVDKTGVE